MSFFRSIRLLVFVGLVDATLQASEPAAQTRFSTNRYTFSKNHHPDGIGKFYQGREIAHVMGHTAADWLERPERDSEEHTGILVDHLDLYPGEVVADIGSGTGYFSRRLAKKVAPGGKVFAVDIQSEMLQLLTNTNTRLGFTNIFPVLGSVTNPALAAASVDLALMVDVYHEFDFPFEMMEGIHRALKPGGRLVLVEYRGEDPNVPIKPLHKMTEAQVKLEMSAHLLQFSRTVKVLPWQHIIIFKKPAP